MQVAKNWLYIVNPTTSTGSNSYPIESYFSIKPKSWGRKDMIEKEYLHNTKDIFDRFRIDLQSEIIETG